VLFVPGRQISLRTTAETLSSNSESCSSALASRRHALEARELGRSTVSGILTTELVMVLHVSIVGMR
jgi:hypothetical protein